MSTPGTTASDDATHLYQQQVECLCEEFIGDGNNAPTESNTRQFYFSQSLLISPHE